MKSPTRSNITLSSDDLKLIRSLQINLKAKSGIEVVRRGLRLLQEVTKGDPLRDAYRRASLAVRDSLSHELAEPDSLVYEGLDERLR